MKQNLPSLFIAGALLAIAPSSFASARHCLNENPNALSRNVAAREKVTTTKTTIKFERTGSRKLKKEVVKMNSRRLVLLGIEETMRITIPQKRERRLHMLQQQLKMKARQAARGRRARCAKQMN